MLQFRDIAVSDAPHYYLPQNSYLHGFKIIGFLPARRYASAGLCDSDVSVRPSVRLSHAGIVSSRAKAGS